MRSGLPAYVPLLLAFCGSDVQAQDWFKGQFGSPLDATTRIYEPGTPAGGSVGDLKLNKNFASFGTARGHMVLRFVETAPCQRTEKYWYVPPCGHLYRIMNADQFARQNPHFCPLVARWIAIRNFSASGSLVVNIYSVENIHQNDPTKPELCLESSFDPKIR